jgi:hypothetical protein
VGTQTDEFYERIRLSHEVISYVEMIAPDQEARILNVLDGDVQCDRTAQVRRSLNCRVVDPTGEITPRATGEVLTPYGTELRPYRGIRWQNNDGTWSEEICPLGVFRLSRSSITYKADGTSDITLEAYDRSRTIQRDKFISPYVIEAGTNVLTAIKEIVKRTFPDVTYDTISTTLTTSAPMLLDTGSDPWDACTQLAKSMGCEIYFDVLGRLVVAPPPDIAAQPAPDFTYFDSDGGHMIDLARDFADESAYNGVIVTGETPGDEKPPVRGEAWDDSPTSPTYRYGNYGEVPTFITDNTAKTEEDCIKIAKAELALLLGRPAALSITSLVNPSYEAGDVVQVTLTRAGVNGGLYGIDAFNVPLAGSATQKLILRERRTS